MLQVLVFESDDFHQRPVVLLWDKHPKLSKARQDEPFQSAFERRGGAEHRGLGPGTVESPPVAQVVLQRVEDAQCGIVPDRRRQIIKVQLRKPIGDVFGEAHRFTIFCRMCSPARIGG